MTISHPAITPESVMNDVHTLADAKAILRDMRRTVVVLSQAYGEEHSTTRDFSARYDSYLDEVAYRHSKGMLA